MLKNKIHLKNKMHILLIISFISVVIISFFFMANTAKAETTDWSIPGYNGNVFDEGEVNADEPKNKYRIGIDDIVYNRVPLFDVNVFSDKPGGQQIETTSPLYYLRTIVANWFVLGMNMALAVMIIIIMYTGIRMALTTIAEKKAEYKEMLFNFVKAIAKIFVLAALMALIMNICQYLTSLFADHAPQSNSEISGKNLYVSMVTRALGSFSFKAKIPAAILFFGLALTFFKFCYRYTKRLLNVYLLIIIAPVLVAKDAYEGASGKQGKTFSAWLQEFTLNVALQPAHALIYTALVYVALEKGTEDILSFFIAVLIMNFMVSADKIFFKIFNMRFTKGPGAAGATDALTEGVKMYAGIQAVKEGAKLSAKAVKGTAKFAQNTGRVIGGTAKNVSNKIASLSSEEKREERATNKKQKAQKKRNDEREGVPPKGPLAPVINASRDLKDTVDRLAKGRNQRKRERNAKKAYGDIQGLQDFEQGNGLSAFMPKTMKNFIADAKTDKAIKDLGKARPRKDDDKSFLSQLNELRKLSKRNDETGRITRKLLKMKKDHEIKKFKYVAGAIAGVAAQGISILAAPALIAADETDIALAGITATMGNTSTAIAKHYYYRRNAKDELLTKRSFEDTLESLKNANGDLGTLQAKFDAIDIGDREARKETYIQMAAYSELKIDEHTIKSMVNAYLLKKDIKTFDKDTITEIVEQVLADSGVKDLGIKAEDIKNRLVAEMLNSQANHRVEANFAEALNPGSEEGKGKKNRYTANEVVEMAKQAADGEDLSELTDNQIERIVDTAMRTADIDATENRYAFSKAKEELLAIANEQREQKFAEEMQKLVDQEATFEQLETTAERLVEMLAVEKLSDQNKYVKIVLEKLDLTGSLNEDQRKEIEKRIKEKVSKAIAKNNETKNIDRVDTDAASSAIAKNEETLVKEGLNALGDGDVLSPDVRAAIDRIKRDVKHEKTKKGSIGTITDLDRRLRSMRDIL